MANNNKRVRLWRGTKESYNVIAKAGRLDYWTRYSVKQSDGSWLEYYGDNLISEPSGSILPVIDIVATLPTVLNPGDRYLVGKDATANSSAEYYIVEIGLEKDNGTGYQETTKIKEFKEGISVRVKNRKFKTYVLVEGEIITYDEVNGGTYDV